MLQPMRPFCNLTALKRIPLIPILFNSCSMCSLLSFLLSRLIYKQCFISLTDEGNPCVIVSGAVVSWCCGIVMSRCRLYNKVYDFNILYYICFALYIFYGNITNDAKYLSLLISSIFSSIFLHWYTTWWFIASVSNATIFFISSGLHIFAAMFRFFVVFCCP